MEFTGIFGKYKKELAGKNRKYMTQCYTCSRGDLNGCTVNQTGWRERADAGLCPGYHKAPEGAMDSDNTGFIEIL